MVGVIATGLISWLVPLSSARLVTVAHAILGLFVVAVAPFKVRGSVRAGFRRKSLTRFASALFGVIVIAAVAAGLTHGTGVLFSTGVGAPLWLHLLFGLSAIPLLGLHIWTRPVRPKPIDLNRRGVLTGSAAAALAVTALVTKEVALDVTGARGADREGTGSIEIASFDPANMPQVSWLNDSAPSGLVASSWQLRVGGESVSVVDDLAAVALSLIHI